MIQFNQTRLLLLLPLIAVLNLSHGAPSDTYQMHATCQINGKWIVSILNIQNGQRFWLRSGQGIGDLKFHSFDGATHTATLSHLGENFSLKLNQATDSPQNVSTSVPAYTSRYAEVEHKVNLYRKGIMQMLEAPASGPRRPEAQSKLQRDLSNMVANYRASLINESAIKQEESLHSSVSDQDQKIIGIKRKNRVNSRIWASDHIEKHGLPIE